MTMKLKTTIFLVMMIALLTACTDGNQQSEVENVKELVNGYSMGTEDAASASITSTELIVTNEQNKQTRYDISKEDFFVSIAPFINETHPCEIHSLTGCQGELVNKDFDLYIEDENGDVILDESMNSSDNGFIDLWLPRDQTFKVKISHEGKEVDSEISTFDNSWTCITTMQLT